MDERKTKGIKDTEGKTATPISGGDKYERRRKTLENLTGQTQPKPAKGYGEFSPTIDRFLKEHLFADIFDSDVLTYRQRELATISALASMDGVEPQLKSHIAIGKNTGLTQSQLDSAFDLIKKISEKQQSETSVPKDMIERISEIEIEPEFLEKYKAILKEEATDSVKLEAGVISIFPMFQKQNPTQVRILEIYANNEAYQSHLKTPHFQKYKTMTLKMVKSLNLVDMDVIAEKTMTEIFNKMENNEINAIFPKSDQAPADKFTGTVWVKGFGSKR